MSDGLHANPAYVLLPSQFVTCHVHRVYVVEAADRPRVVAVVTLTDVLRLITS